MSETEKLKRELHVAVQVDKPSYLVDLCHRALKRIDQLEADKLRMLDRLDEQDDLGHMIRRLELENERLRSALRSIADTRWDSGAAEACLTMIKDDARSALKGGEEGGEEPEGLGQDFIKPYRKRG